MTLEAGTFLVQWATGGLAFLWVTTRRREVGLGYGWLLRATYGLLALGGAGLYTARDSGVATTVVSVGALAVAAAVGTSLAVSIVRRGAGVAGRQAERQRRRERVASMVGVSASAPDVATRREHPPALDLVAPAIGVVALLFATVADGGPYALGAARLVVGALFLGAVTDAMLLGHWYLVQPGLRRAPLEQLVLCTALLWPVEVLVLLLPDGMAQVLAGSIDDGYGGLLGWVWLACAVSTIALVGVTWAALRERYYSAVMSATGLLYLAILTAFGTDLVARAVLAP
jgi:hypothetical protein